MRLKTFIVLSMWAICLAVMILSPAQSYAQSYPQYQFTKTTSGTGTSWGNSVATDSSGDSYTAGGFDGTVTFDGSGGSDNISSTNDDAFVTKRAENGSYDWTRYFDVSNGTSTAFGVATDSSGDVYITGIWSGTVVFDGPGGSDSLTSSNDNSFLTKYSSNGSYDWTKTFSVSSNFADAQSVAVDQSGNIDITGYWQGTVTFNSAADLDTQTSSSLDSFVTQFNSSGDYGWTETGDTPSGTIASSAVAVDTSGDVYTCGGWYGTVIFDGPGGTDTRTTANTASYITKYSSSGAYQWTSVTGSDDYAQCQSLAVDSNGDAYITGTAFGGIDFDGQGGSDYEYLDNDNAYLIKYSPSGAYDWSRYVVNTDGSVYSFGAGVAIDYLGNIYISGTFVGNANFDSVGNSDPQEVTNWSDYITKINSDGSYGWTKIQDPSEDAGVYNESFYIGLATDLQGQVLMTNDYYGTVTFDGPGGTDTQSSSTDQTFLTSYLVIPPDPSLNQSNQSQGSVSTPSSDPDAPDTGYGTNVTSKVSGILPIILFLSILSISMGARLLGGRYYRRLKS